MGHENGGWMNSDQREAIKADALFPIMGDTIGQRRGYIPMAFIRRAATQCKRNHGQTPERLRERGGLSPQEAAAVIGGVRYGNWQFADDGEAWAHLQLVVVAEFPGFDFATGDWPAPTASE